MENSIKFKSTITIRPTVIVNLYLGYVEEYGSPECSVVSLVQLVSVGDCRSFSLFSW